ncbi:hypothetical protein Droror1_Dr00004834 [Drosera rotundifolia]
MYTSKHQTRDESLNSMGATKQEDEKEGDGVQGKLRKWNTCIAGMASFLVSIAGGGLLLYWEMEYHPKNRQLWMVPFGLIMFCTPIIVWFCAIVSDVFCTNKDEGLPIFCKGGSAANAGSGFPTRVVINSPENGR